jgi:hypothetical protein
MIAVGVVSIGLNKDGNPLEWQLLDVGQKCVIYTFAF